MEDFSEYDDDSQVEKTIPTLLEDTYTSNEGLFASEEAASNQVGVKIQTLKGLTK